ncbi:UDP-N-acetylglucosamine 4,6-dehydratase [hydrothermal vent metagenome]|uniref:UDP-N-acetylglucosamine 4,6-dehydratase n=1 Tax=hydrothermal vent metagenome TaxID=652676 RepID=A0A1W1EKM9_9ZZZZ
MILRQIYMRVIDKRFLNFLVIIVLSLLTFLWTFKVFHWEFNIYIVAIVIACRILASFLIFKDYSQSWSKASPKTFLLKSLVYIGAFSIYMPYFYTHVAISFLASELFVYMFSINFAMYSYNYFINRSPINKNKKVVIYGAGKAGIQLREEFSRSEYKVVSYLDDDRVLQGRSIDTIKIRSPHTFISNMTQEKYDLLVIAMPSASKKDIKRIYQNFKDYFYDIQILPSIEEILRDKDYSKQLKDISIEDLLAREPQDLDKDKISSFIKDKTILITGAGGSIGSQIVRECIKFQAKELILLDHSEFNLYSIDQEIEGIKTHLVMQSVVDIEKFEITVKKYRPQIIIHAAAYKHVPLCEENIFEAITNNIIGTKNSIDLAIKYEVEKFILISTDKAVRPTNVMGTTKRVCELYASNVDSKKTEIVSVRFGNVLGSSGSVIPKFQAQINSGKNITVTHPEITRYFMLIPEACELVLQAGAIGKGGELFILDMGEPIKIVDLASRMIELSGRDDIEIEFTGLRAGEKLYEELLIDDSDASTQYESITVAKPTIYDIDKLNSDINELLISDNKLEKLKEIVPEFKHNKG